MIYLIDKIVLDITTECEYGFACLTNYKPDLCKIETCEYRIIHFIKCLGESSCIYFKPIGENCFSSFPAQKDLFNHLKIFTRAPPYCPLLVFKVWAGIIN